MGGKMWKYNEQKAAEAAWKMLRLGGGQMNYMKLIKLLYIADRKAIARWERPITTDEFFAMKNGPVLSHIYDQIKGSQSENGNWEERISHGKGKYEIKTRSEQVQLRELCEAEVEMLESVYAEFGHLNQYQLRDYMHEHFQEYTPPDPISSSERIKLERVLEAVDYSPESIQRITTEISEETAINALLEKACY